MAAITRNKELTRWRSERKYWASVPKNECILKTIDKTTGRTRTAKAQNKILIESVYSLPSTNWKTCAHWKTNIAKPIAKIGAKLKWIRSPKPVRCWAENITALAPVIIKTIILKIVILNIHFCLLLNWTDAVNLLRFDFFLTKPKWKSKINTVKESPTIHNICIICNSLYLKKRSNILNP